MDLETATIEDMVAELERRGIAVGVFVSHVSGKHYIPGPDVPPEEREKCYASIYKNKHPLHIAAFLCRGVQCCLSDLSDSLDEHAERADESLTWLSMQLAHFQKGLEFWDERFLQEPPS